MERWEKTSWGSTAQCNNQRSRLEIKVTGWDGKI